MITLFSDEQLVALSKIFERMIFAAASAQIGAVVDDHRDVAGAHAERRRAAGITRAHVGLRAGDDDEVALLHELAGAFLGHRRGQHLHEVGRRADALELRMHVFEQLRAGGVAFGRRRQDDRVAALQRVDDVVGGRRARDWWKARPRIPRRPGARFR